MKKRLVFLSCVVFSVELVGNGVQVWTQENIDYPLANGVILGVSQENRIGLNRNDNTRHIDEIHIAPSVGYNITDWMSLGMNYRHVLLRDGSDVRYTNDRRPGIDVAVKKKVCGVSFLNRSRFICRMVEHENPYFRYRNLSKVSIPVGVFSPFISYEWYYDEGSHHRYYRKNDRFSQQWLSFGSGLAITENLNCSLSYMLTENKDRAEHNWYNGHVIMFSVSYRF